MTLHLCGNAKSGRQAPTTTLRLILVNVQAPECDHKRINLGDGHDDCSAIAGSETSRCLVLAS